MDAQNTQNTVTISSQEYKELILESAELKARVKDAESKESDERSKRWSVESELTTLKEKTKSMKEFIESSKEIKGKYGQFLVRKQGEGIDE